MNRRRKTVALLPTLITLGNLVCGFLAIVVAARIGKPEGIVSFQGINPDDVSNAMIAGWLIFAGMVCDAMDGQIARLANSTSQLGAELDSLCDLVSFGVAPAFLFVKISPYFVSQHDKIVWVIATLFVSCVALRLARFNVETSEEDDHLNFNGLPSPAGAAVIAGFALGFYALFQEAQTRENPEFIHQIYYLMQLVMPYLTVATALLMVSNIRYPHAANHLLNRERSIQQVVIAFACVAGVLLRPHILIPTIAFLFLLLGPSFFVLRVFKRDKGKLESGS